MFDIGKFLNFGMCDLNIKEQLPIKQPLVSSIRLNLLYEKLNLRLQHHCIDQYLFMVNLLIFEIAFCAIIV